MMEDTKAKCACISLTSAALGFSNNACGVVASNILKSVMKKILIPWKLPHYQVVNGNHPLFSGLLNAPEPYIQYVFPDAQSGFSSTDLGHITSEIMMMSYKIGKRFPSAAEHHAEALNQYLSHYIETRDIQALAALEAYRGRVDGIFHHTTPLHLSTMPFVLHFESLTTLFYPFLLHGYNGSVELRRELIFQIVKEQLESPACRAVFTHIKDSVDILKRAFASEIINEKVHYVPLGVEIPDKFHSLVEQKLSSPPQKEGLNILFTNSAHGAGANLLWRGGHDLLAAFQRHRQTHPQSVLTMLSSGAEAFAPVHPELMEGVTWIEQGINDEALYALLLNADVFALPAAGLHSYSVLRAMRCGAVLICSDAPGYDEFVQHHENAVVLTGRRAHVYSQEIETGWWRDDYSAMQTFHSAIIAQLTLALDDLADNPSRRLALAGRALRDVQTRHDVQPWVQGVANILRHI